MVVKHGPCLLTVRKGIQAFETKCLRKRFRVSHLEHKTNDCVPSNFNFLEGPQEPLLAIVKRWTLEWFGHVTFHDSLFKTKLQEMLDVRQRVDIPAHARTAHRGILQKRLESLLNRPSSHPDDQIGQGTELN